MIFIFTESYSNVVFEAFDCRAMFVSNIISVNLPEIEKSLHDFLPALIAPIQSSKILPVRANHGSGPMKVLSAGTSSGAAP